MTGQVIRRLRERVGISQERLAAEAGIDRTHVGTLERRGANTGVATIHALLTAMNASWSEFGAALDSELSRRKVAMAVRELLPQRATTREATAVVIAAIIKAIRRRLNVSQEDWAHLAGVDRTYVAKVERAIVNPTLYRLNRLLGAAAVSWREFGETLDAALEREIVKKSKVEHDEIA